jgi:type IV pilus assembly protein PilF
VAVAETTGVAKVEETTMPRSETQRPLSLIAAAASVLLAVTVACGPSRTQQAAIQPKELSTNEKIRMADSFRSAGRMNDALELLAEVVAADPENARLNTVYGEYLFLGGRYVEAEQRLTKALELDPYLTDARNWLGASLAEQQRYDEAKQQYEKALEDPAYPSPQLIYLNLGMLHRTQGLDDKAIGQFRRAVQIDPRFFKAHFELALALDAVGQFEEALDEVVVAEPAYRNDGDYWYRRGFLEFRLQRPNRALESLRRCLDVSPGSPAAAQARELMGVIQG